MLKRNNIVNRDLPARESHNNWRKTMATAEHKKAAELHQEAAKSHTAAADCHAKGDAMKGDAKKGDAMKGDAK